MMRLGQQNRAKVMIRTHLESVSRLRRSSRDNHPMEWFYLRLHLALALYYQPEPRAHRIHSHDPRLR